ncbi:hypothetical protein [Nocardia nova]|uniref:hypothetical protein n=1 Tax=Nocardia nova TaxID=37330 RepID=UPI0033CC42B6
MSAVTFGFPGIREQTHRLSAGIDHAYRLRAAVEASAACVSAGTAGLAMMLPISRSGLAPGSSLQVDLLIFNMPLALTAGALIAVIAVSVSAAIGSSRLAWCAVFCATTAMLLNHVLLVRLETRTLSTLNYVDSMLAGVILGCLAVAVWGRTVPAGGYLFGALASILVGDLIQSPDDPAAAVSEVLLRGAPPVWLILVAVVLMLMTAVLFRQGPRPEPDSVSVVPLKPVLAAVVIASATLATSVWLARSGTVTAILVGGAILLAATAVAALLLPGRDGLLVVAMVAFADAGSTVLTVPRPGWSMILIALIAGIALYAGWRMPRPMAAVLASVALALGAALTSALIDTPSAWVTVPGCVVLSAVAGYALGSTVGPRATSTVVGITILFVPSAGVALQGRDVGRVEYSQSWYRSAEVTHTALPGIVAAGLGVGCALIALMIGRLRPARRTE